jgi:hypothetical protein
VGVAPAMSEPARTYRISGFQPYFMLLVLVILTAFSPVVALSFLRSGGWFNLIWLGVLGWFWFNALFRTVYRIDLRGDMVRFKTLATRKETRFDQIRSIRSVSVGYVTIRFEGGRVDVVGALDGWHDFVSRIKDRNPAVELKGV